MRASVLALVAALALCGCSTAPKSFPMIPPVTASADVTFRIHQGQAALHVAQTAILRQRDAADKAGRLGSSRAQVFALTNRVGPLNTAVNAVDTAASTLNAATFDAQVATAYTVIAQVSALLPKAK